MRSPRTVAAASTSALAAVLALWLAGGASAAKPAYVALGDSYSSGVGAGSYVSSSGSCQRSTNAYPYLWAAAHAPSSFSNTACSGATTTDVLNKQLGPLDSATGLVSISAGGNDVGFSDVLSSCWFSPDSACLSRIAEARSYAEHTLPGRLDTLYSAIRAKAPAAHVVVLGYPAFYQLGGSCVGGLSDTKRAAISGAADDLNTVIAERAAAHGFTYGDVRSAFASHELCSRGEWWLHGLTAPLNESYHPTAGGQSGGYLPVFTAQAG
ncbi:SGNH/GDSL hydrolase family protein [Streptomyces sp. NPDC054804]